jgi:hypothetical protein
VRVKPVRDQIISRCVWRGENDTRPQDLPPRKRGPFNRASDKLRSGGLRGFIDLSGGLRKYLLLGFRETRGRDWGYSPFGLSLYFPSICRYRTTLSASVDINAMDCTYRAGGGLVVAALAGHLEGDIVGGVALDLKGASREMVEVLVEEL